MNNGGSAAGQVTLRSETPGGAIINANGSGANAIAINANYITVEGFEIKNSNADGIEANSVHHIEILNNVIHDNDESGIQFNYSEFILVEGNVTYGNAAGGWFSGISIYENRNVSGDTTTGGYRTIVRDNISYDNVTEVGAHTDGNGIIIDDFQHTQNSGYPSYTYPTLVENNLVYENGGKGIQVTWSDNVTVRGNTAYHNNQDLLNTGTWRGEISNSQSSNNTFVNNIAVADPSIHSANTAYDNTSYGGYVNKVVWANNLSFNGTNGAASVKTDGGNSSLSAANGNILGVNPGFINPSAGNFQLSSSSVAIDAGTSAYGLPSSDLDGGSRVIGTVDLGAYETGSGSTTTGSTGSTGSGTTTNTGSGTTSGSNTSTGTSGGTTTGSSGSNTGSTSGSNTGTNTGTNTGSNTANEDTGTFSLYDDSDTPLLLTDPDPNSVQLGLKFKADVDAQLEAISFFKGAQNTGVDSVSLWKADGTLVAQQSVSGLSGQGWQQVEFNQAVSLEAGESYIAAYHTSSGYYSVTQGYYTSATDAGPISIGANAGVYAYGGANAFPNATYNGSNYWVDVVLNTDSTSGSSSGSQGSSTGGTGGTVSGEAVDAGDVIGESGVVRVSQSSVDQWHTVSFTEALDNPSVVMSAMSISGQSFTVRVRNVTDTGFQYQIDEWDYQDGRHVTEQLAWVAIESGEHTLADGRTIAAGSASIGDSKAAVGYGGASFSSAPVVLGQVTGDSNDFAINDRIDDVGRNGFRVLLEQQEAKVGNIVSESFDWIAIEQGGASNGSPLVGSTGDIVTHRDTKVDFGSSMADKFAFISDMQTYDGNNAATVEIVALNTSGATMRIAEETSRDSELNHTSEEVGFAGFEIGQIHAADLLVA